MLPGKLSAASAHGVFFVNTWKRDPDGDRPRRQSGTGLSSGRQVIGWRSMHRRTFWNARAAESDKVLARVPGALRILLLAVPIVVAIIIAAVFLLPGDADEGAQLPTVVASDTAVAGSTSAGVAASETGAAAEFTVAVSESTPAATLAPSTVAVGAEAVVVGTEGAGARMRTGPGLDADVLTIVADGAQVLVTAGPQNVDDHQWWQVKVGNDSGWMVGDFLVPRQ
jgi:hypothetical protein